VVSIRLKSILDETFQDYKKPSMLLATCSCDWKCLKERDLDISICQNSEIAKQKNINVSVDEIVDRYINNPITQSIIIAGLEPMLQFDEVLNFVDTFRNTSDDDIIIYTGYYPDEIMSEIEQLKQYKNIIVKFGRYIPNRKKRFDMNLGIELISDNQFAVKIS